MASGAPDGRLDRRTLLGSAAAAVALGGLGGRAAPARAALTLPDPAGVLSRLVDLGAAATVQPGSPRDLRVSDNRALLAESGTAWIRLWADWPSLQPDPAVALGDPASAGAPYLDALDGQIAAANQDGLRVALLLYRFPAWANGTQALAAVRGTDAEISHAYPDRIAPAAWARYLAAGRDPAAYTPSRRDLAFATPAEGCGPGTAWAGMFAALHERYRPDRAIGPGSTRSSWSTSPTSRSGPSARRRPPPTSSPSGRSWPSASSPI